MSQTTYPMESSAPAAQRPRRGRGVVGPVLLIGLGAMILLHNLNILPHALWGSIWRLWPLVFIAIGTDLLLRDRLSQLLRGLLMVALFLVGIVAISTSSPVERAATSGGSPDTFEAPLDGVTRADVSVRSGVGRLSVGALPVGNSRLGVMTSEGSSWLQPEQRLTTADGVAKLEYRLRNTHQDPSSFFQDHGPRNMDVLLAPGVPLSLDVQTGAAEARLDLTRLDVDRLTLRTGASTIDLRLPEGAGATSVRVSGGASTLTVEVPQSVAADITFRGGLSTLKTDKARFPSVGREHYRSPDYDTAANRVDLTIEVGAASVTVR